jgi:hypothetical protein
LVKPNIRINGDYGGDVDQWQIELDGSVVATVSPGQWDLETPTPGQTYDVRIRALGAGFAPSPWSEVLSVSHEGTLPQPTVNFEVVDGTDLRFYWTAGDATSWTVTIDGVDVEPDVTAAEYVIADAEVGQNYQCYVMARADDWFESVHSETVDGQVEVEAEGPGTPEGLTITIGASMQLSWSAPSLAATYSVYRVDNSANPSSATWTLLASGLTNTDYTDSTVSAGVERSYRVTAENSGGTSGSPSTHVSGMYIAVPEAGVTTWDAGVEYNPDIEGDVFYIVTKWVGVLTHVSYQAKTTSQSGWATTLVSQDVAYTGGNVQVVIYPALNVGSNPSTTWRIRGRAVGPTGATYDSEWSTEDVVT